MRREAFLEKLTAQNPHEPEFHQAVQELVWSVYPWLEGRRDYAKARILERMVEPDRVVMFRVVWEDDQGEFHVEKGYRVQFNGALGPYKGGLRFRPTVNLSVLKFLGFEQVFKNALTGLPMGGGKGGSTFNPKGRSDAEVMRFCQAFMTELYRHIGPDTDVPAGDIGVGPREIGYLFGQYKRIVNRWTGAITGKAPEYGGSLIREEATGYGAVYFTEELLRHHGGGLEGKVCAVSGAGNVAQYCIEKLLELGAKVVTVSDSTGFVHLPEGFDTEKLEWLQELKNVRRGSLGAFAEHFGLTFAPGERPWKIPVDWAFPCATENEIDQEDAQALVRGGCEGVTEGANMPTDLGAMRIFQEAGLFFAPGKAANAGGVGVSGLEMSQNAIRSSWSAEKVDGRLLRIMRGIHDQCVEYGGVSGGRVDYVRGANIAGFCRVADTMLAYGAV